MLYILMEINGYKFQAFVDTGAQSTIISKKFCESIGLMKDVDHRFRGVAVGVGTSSIIGRIHTAKLKLENGRTIECSLQVLEQIDIDFLFGIDMMKKFRVQLAYPVSNRPVRQRDKVSVGWFRCAFYQGPPHQERQ